MVRPISCKYGEIGVRPVFGAVEWGGFLKQSFKSMPRLLHSLLLRARNISPLLSLLLRPCRTLPSARNELRWLREHALAIASARRDYPREVGALILQLCRQRSKGVPLQYLLGSQPFGELDILCRSGVLIPRSVTFVIFSI
jgi:methylase of polypeptide subunit release factors